MTKKEQFAELERKLDDRHRPYGVPKLTRSEQLELIRQMTHLKVDMAFEAVGPEGTWSAYWPIDSEHSEVSLHLRSKRRSWAERVVDSLLWRMGFQDEKEPT